MGSCRLPGKSMKEIAGIPLLRYVIERVKAATTLDRVILATSTDPQNDPLCALAESLGVGVYRGSEEDVLSRFTAIARETGADTIVRICADNPLVDPAEIDRVVGHHRATGSDYSFNHVPTARNRYPDGLGAEVVNARILLTLEAGPLTDEEREHVTLGIRRKSSEYRIGEPVAPPGIMGPDIRLDIDTPEDFSRMEGFIASLPATGRPLWTGQEIVRRHREYFHSRVLFLLHRREDAERYCDEYRERVAGAMPLAASPGAWWELEKRGITCLWIQDYFDREEMYRLGMANYGSIEQICGIVDRILGAHNPTIARDHLQPARSDFYHLKILFDNLCITVRLLRRVTEKETPALICVPVSVGEGGLPADPDHFFREDLNWYARLLIQDGWVCPTILLPVEDRKLPSPGPSLRTRLHAAPLPFHLLKTAGLPKTLALLPTLAAGLFRRNRSLLLLGYGYGWNRMLPTLLEAGYVPRLVSTAGVRRGDPVSLPDLSKEGMLRQLLTSDGIDLSPLVIPYLHARLAQVLPCITPMGEAIARMADRDRPVAVLSGPRGTAGEQLYAQLARGHGIPVVTWQHGAYGTSRSPVVLYTDFLNSDLFLSWGTGVQETLQHDPLNTFPCRIIPTGSCELQELGDRSGGDRKGRGVLYITTNYYANSLYISYRLPYHDNTLWETQKAILDALENRGEAILKLHPGSRDERQFREYLQSRGHGNITLADGSRSLEDLLGEADAVIIDFPSTTLLQAIAAGKTVFVLTRHRELSPGAAALLNKRAHCTGDLKEFTEMIRKYLDGESLPAGVDRADTGFLEAYGLYRADGRVGERALGVLRDLETRGGPSSP